jgi:phenylacetate-coenzyme A ligase PaaK-like adenylate-forming protein
MLEIFENAGASVLSAGQHMRPAEVAQLITKYQANVLSGDSSQVVSIVHCISTLPKEERGSIKLSKIIYTSEGLTPSQRTYILEVFPYIQIYSILGSAEAGPYAVSYSHSTIRHWFKASYEDFIFDTRRIKIEILPLSSSEQDSHPEFLEDGEQGMIAQTSLMRLRNPLVRYVTGDIGSLHPLSEDVKALVPETHWEYLRILRLHGRDRRFSFEWDGEYLEFSALNAMLNDTRSRVLQWQVVLDKMEPSKEQLLKLYILRSAETADGISKEDLVHQIKTFFHVFSANCSRFKLVFLEDNSTFKRSETSRKIIKFVNNYN